MGFYSIIRRELLDSITAQLEGRTDDIQEGILIKSPPGMGKSSIIRQIVYNDIADMYNRYIIDLGSPDYTMRIKIDEAWHAVEKDIMMASKALQQVEKQYGKDAKDLFKEEARIMLVTNAIQNFEEMVKAIVIEEGNMTLEEYEDLVQRKRELENIMMGHPDEITDEMVEEYKRVVEKTRMARIKREAPLVFYDANTASATLADLSGLNVRVLGTMTKIPPWPYVLLKAFGGIINFDEISNLTDNAKATALYKIVLDRKIGDISFIPKDPDALGVAITATGNTMATSTAVTTLPQALIDRFAKITINGLSEDDKFSLGNYFMKKYAMYTITPKFVSILVNMNLNDILHVPDSDEFSDDEDKFPTPRGYEYGLKALARRNGDMPRPRRVQKVLEEEGIIVKGALLGTDARTREIVKETLAPRIGIEAAERFATKWILDVPLPEEIIEDPERLTDLIPRPTAFMIAVTDYLRYLINRYHDVKISSHCKKDPKDCKKHAYPIMISSVAAAKRGNAELIQLILNWAEAMEPDFKPKILRMTLAFRNSPEDKKLLEDFIEAFKKSK